MLWLVGGILTFCGLSIWLEFGLALPRSGGEKNYLERAYKKPKYLMTCVLASQMILLGFSSGNALAFGRYALFASGSESPDGWTARGLGVACTTFAVLLHATFPKWGIRDRKSTRLNSSHGYNSYAAFCLKKKTQRRSSRRSRRRSP